MHEEPKLVHNEYRTVYVDLLSMYTSEEQIFETFSKCGEIKRIIIGRDPFYKTFSGFCFVEYFTHDNAKKSVNFLNGSKIDEQTIRVRLDKGFEEGRQYGRYKSSPETNGDRFSFNHLTPEKQESTAKSGASMSAEEMWGPSRNSPTKPQFEIPPIFGRDRARNDPRDRYLPTAAGNPFYGASISLPSFNIDDPSNSNDDDDGYPSKRRRYDIQNQKIHPNDNS